MIARHTLTYVGSRAVAAALNLASLAAFTRLAPVEIYGTYLFVLSWAFVLYGATCQWPKFAFFALYEEDRAAAQVGTVVRLLLCMLLLASLAAGGAAALGLVEPRIAASVVAATIGMTVFEGANEIARTRLAAEAVGLSVIARGVLVLALGSLALRFTGDAFDLVLAVALANILAAIPSGLAIRPLVARGRASMAEALRLLAYGWPLVFSLGLAALAQSIDRLIIGKTISAQELGEYGAIADFLRQSFIVFGEGIAVSMVAIAKRDARLSGMEAALPVLRDAARALALVAAFGAVFFLSLDDIVVSILLGPGYRDAAIRLAPLLIAASVCAMFRGYYFGQSIYFTKSSAIDAVASGVTLAAIGGLSLVLIPRYGVEGAAIAVAAGQALACLVFLVGAKGGLRMPVPLADMLLIACAALGTWAALSSIDLLPGAIGAPWIALKLALLGLGAAATAWHFDIAGIAGILARRSRRAA